MGKKGRIIDSLVALVIFIIGFLFAVPTSIDLAVMVAGLLNLAIPNDIAPILIEQYTLVMRILGWIIMIGDVVLFTVVSRKLKP